jgi:flagellar motor protein MotB
MWSPVDGPAQGPAQGPTWSPSEPPHPRDLLMTDVPRARRWRQAAWLLLGMAAGAVAVWIVHSIQDAHTLRLQLASAVAARDAIDADRRALTRELAAARGPAAPLATTALARELQTRLRPGQVTVDGAAVRITFPAATLFAGGGAELSSAGGRLLDRAGTVLRKLAGAQIVVSAHTDTQPPARFDSNWELSAARAVNVTRHLCEESGVDPARLSAAARAQFDPRPSVPGRRVEIVVSPGR